MKVIAYLAFTLLSIVIQFCVMDFIGNGVAITEEKPVDQNLTSTKKRLNDVLKDFVEKPHALYYRAQKLSKVKDNNTDIKRIYSNATIPGITLETSTDLSSTLFDLLYDDNVTEARDTFTTEDSYITTEIDTVTEISLFEKKNETNIKHIDYPKKQPNKDCSCNFLYKVCDINCCCDTDCNDAELRIFVNCINDPSKDITKDQFCYSHHSLYGIQDGSDPDNLFCIAKTNLPEKRRMYDTEIIQDKKEISFKWRENRKAKPITDFNKKEYKYGDPLWMLKNGSIYYVDLPTSLSNNYCAARKPIRFLKDEKLKCNIKFGDLEMLHLLSVAETIIISGTDKTFNSTKLNCSSLHCTNWTVVICEGDTCTDYNKSLHEALCSENVCTNIALKLDYIFHYYDKRIINATIMLYVQKLYLNIPLLEQEINVYFLLANRSIENIIELSGNPGYINGLPVIVSYAKINYTDLFYNTTPTKKMYLPLPFNENGVCVISNLSDFLIFGLNKRMKCRLNYVHNGTLNAETCKSIQNDLNMIFGLNRKIAVSPFGNPQDLKDEEWISVQQNTLESTFYGEINNDKSVLYCFNLINSLSLTIAYVDASEGQKRQNKIISVKSEVFAQNVSYNVEDISTLVTLDILFLDKTIPKVYEFAGGPHLNIHLPSDFFFPFPSDRAYSFKGDIYVIYLCLMFYQINIF